MESTLNGPSGDGPELRIRRSSLRAIANGRISSSRIQARGVVSGAPQTTAKLAATIAPKITGRCFRRFRCARALASLDFPRPRWSNALPAVKENASKRVITGSRLVGSDLRAWQRLWTDYGQSGSYSPPRNWIGPEKRGGLKESMQHWPVVYSPEFQSPTSCVGAD